jgi:hypothetical protein
MLTRRCIGNRKVWSLYVWGSTINHRVHNRVERPVTDLVNGRLTPLSIVAVHGLGGHWERTWTDENGKLWLRDFLPSQIPNARIMSYGYNSDTAFSKAVTDINDEAAMLLNRLNNERCDKEKTRPIIFISHSLGGIVVKKAGLPLLLML